MSDCCKHTPGGSAPRHCFNLEEPAPGFTAPAYYNNAEVNISLSQYRGKWLLLFFYSSDFTFV